MRQNLRKCFSILLFVVCICSCTRGWGADKPNFLLNIPELLKRAQSEQNGLKVVTIVMQAAEVAQLFPVDPKKRLKADFPAVLTDGTKAFLGTISPGGQSSLKVATPNLRVSDIQEILKPGEGKDKKSSALVGVPIIDGTIRLNPMTMDEGYINTLTYLELINHFRLLPPSDLPLLGEYAKVVYRFVDGKDQWTTAVNPADGVRMEFRSAGLHLANFHPVKYLKEIDSDAVKVLAVARSRYNVLNKIEAAKRMFGKSSGDETGELFSSADVKNSNTTPFRVEIKWAKKTKAEKDQNKPEKGLENVTLLKDLLTRVYSAPRKFQGKELYSALSEVLNIQQWFRFMALNRLLENGDISDEYFWYVEKDEKTGKTRLGLMPQDGDDMFKGAHFFPTSPKQIGLIVNSSGLAKKLGLGYGYIMNYEDPLFRVVQDDPWLFHQYLIVFDQLAGDIASTGTLDKIMGSISAKISPFAKDKDVLARGKLDERGQEYSSDSFNEAIKSLKSRVRENAVKALAKLRKSAGNPGDLEKAREAAGHP